MSELAAAKAGGLPIFLCLVYEKELVPGVSGGMPRMWVVCVVLHFEEVHSEDK